MAQSSKRMDARLSAKDLAVIEQNYRLRTHAEIAAMIGRSTSCVRSACSRKGWLTRDDYWSDQDLAKLISWYARPGSDGRDTLNLDGLASELGRDKANVCRKARSLGLTNQGRALRTKEARKKASDNSKKSIREKGHPRGALGMKHSEETLRVLSEKSRSAWAERKKRPILMHLTRQKTVQTNIDRYGVALPAHALNKGANVYSRCRRGVREDLGIFVRSRWEANYARYLKFLQERGDIAAWEYEPTTFRFEGVGRGPYTYKPDFKVVSATGAVEYHEVKGWMDSASRGKIKRFAKFYPDLKLVVIEQKLYRQIEKAVSSVIAHWEQG
jgi:hypothetical protein